jgi:hypothetical protein
MDAKNQYITTSALRGGPGVGRKEKSTKLPDPEQLSDGKDHSFKGWFSEIRAKLDVNDDDFDSDTATMVYVFSRTKGEAREHLQPRYLSGDDQEFETPLEMLNVLREV